MAKSPFEFTATPKQKEEADSLERAIDFYIGSLNLSGNDQHIERGVSVGKDAPIGWKDAAVRTEVLRRFEQAGWHIAMKDGVATFTRAFRRYQ